MSYYTFGLLIDSPNISYAIFDFDGTLITSKTSSGFPKDKDDWRWRFPNEVKILRNIHRSGYRIVIRTDQSKMYKLEMIKDVIDQLDIPVFVIIAMDKNLYKPDTKLFNKYITNINYEKSFYVGDAAGRKGDWSNVDIQFAKNIGTRFFLPEFFFTKNKQPSFINPLVIEGRTKEVVIMCGIPASGKSRYVKDYFAPENYIIASGDILKSLDKMIKYAQSFYDSGSRKFVFDATNVTKVIRQKYKDFAIRNNIMNCRIIFVDSDVQSAVLRNNFRTESGEAKVPNVAIYTLHKNLQVPNNDEGCDIVYIDSRADKDDSYTLQNSYINKSKFKHLK